MEKTIPEQLIGKYTYQTHRELFKKFLKDKVRFTDSASLVLGLQDTNFLTYVANTEFEGLPDGSRGAYLEAANTLMEVIRNEIIEECAQCVENGSFLHDQSPEALWGKSCAEAIRRLKNKE